jgi:hypothetical protein
MLSPSYEYLRNSFMYIFLSFAFAEKEQPYGILFSNIFLNSRFHSFFSVHLTSHDPNYVRGEIPAMHHVSPAIVSLTRFVPNPLISQTKLPIPHRATSSFNCCQKNNMLARPKCCNRASRPSWRGRPIDGTIQRPTTQWKTWVCERDPHALVVGGSRSTHNHDVGKPRRTAAP